VEAEEDYRALANARVPDGSPQAFYQAQDQAKAEVAQISPRVPTIRILTTPAQIPNVTITVDGQAMNSALVGAARPVNPGTHKIVGSAPGYATAETSVTVQEKDSKDVPLTLRSTGMVTTTQTQQTQPVRQQQPLYEGQGDYNRRPYTEMKRKSPGLWGGGVAMVVVGSLTTFIGLIVVIAGAGAQAGCTLTTVNCDNGKSLETDGIIATTVGVLLLGGGIAMMVVGGKKVPVTEAKWMPKPSAGGLAWTF
jgi:hypothetical protein